MRFKATSLIALIRHRFLKNSSIQKAQGWMIGFKKRNLFEVSIITQQKNSLMLFGIYHILSDRQGFILGLKRSTINPSQSCHSERLVDEAL